MALHGYSSMELKSRSFTSKEPHVARELQVADPCTSVLSLHQQRIRKSHLSITAAHYEVFFSPPNSFLAISSQLLCQLPTQETLSILILAA
jgi:hypothetical protein